MHRPHAAAPPSQTLVLASASPGRRVLLARLGLPFALHIPHVDETPQRDEAAPALAARLARAKAAAVATAAPDSWIVAADTVVVLDHRPLGKPADAAEATGMLRALAGREHTVVTAVCVAAPGELPRTATLATRVWMRAYSAAEIARYVASSEPYDKAGAYAVQDEQFRPVARLLGCRNNVVGLPLCVTAALLAASGLRLPPGAAADPGQTS